MIMNLSSEEVSGRVKIINTLKNVNYTWNINLFILSNNFLFPLYPYKLETPQSGTESENGQLQILF